MLFTDRKREIFTLWIFSIFISILLSLTLYQNMFQLNNGNFIGNIIYFFSFLFCIFPIIYLFSHIEVIKKLFSSKISLSCNQNVSFICFFITSFLILYMVYNNFLDIHYSSDSYSVALNGAYSTHMQNGRIIGGIITYFLENFLGINMVNSQQATSFIHLIILSFCITYLLFLIYQKVCICGRTKFIAITIALMLLFVNVFYVEILLFVESNIIFSLTVLTAVLSAGLSIDDQNNRKGLAFLLLFISVNLYQVAICYYILIVTFILLIKYRCKIIQPYFWYNILPCAVISLLNTVINISISMILRSEGLIGNNERNATLSTDVIIDNIKNIIILQKDLWINGYNLLPRYSCLIIGLTALLFFVAVTIRQIKSKNANLINIIGLYIILFGLYIVSFAPHLISGVFWPAQRTITPWFFFIAFTFILIIIFLERPKENRIILCLLLLFLLLNIQVGNQILTNNKIVNFLDRQLAYELNEKIIEYEMTTGEDVKYIAFYEDSQPQYTYPNVDYLLYDTNIKASRIPWSRVNCINYWLNSDYIETEKNEELDENYFQKKDWQYFNAEEQIIFSGNIVNVGIE